jgi:hypothetical protein
MDIQPEPQTIEVLKWVGIAFATGFVGYFGRHLSKIVIAKVRGEKAERVSVPQPAEETKSESSYEIDKDRLKLEKKKLKLERKKLKEAEKIEK